MIDQKPDVELDTGELSDRRPIQAFAQRGARDRQRVDAIRFAAITAGASLAGHQPRRDSDDALTVDQQEPLERPGHVPAVLKRPDAPGRSCASSPTRR